MSSSKQSPSGGSGGNATSSSSTSSSLPSKFPTGPSARRELRKTLLQTTDPASTIQNFQQSHSLHSMFARAFDTTAIHNLPSYSSSKNRSSTRATTSAKSAESDAGIIAETFEPEPVLSFLTHLGVSRHEVHKAVSTALRSAVEDEISRISQSNSSALLQMLYSSWPFQNVPEIRPVVVTILKKLGDGTPTDLLQELAKKDSKGGDDAKLKYGELLSSFGLSMKRLVWEAEYDAFVSKNEENNEMILSLKSGLLISDLISPAVDEYKSDELFSVQSELSFVGTIRERKISTLERRKTTGATATVGDIGSTDIVQSSSTIGVNPASKKDESSCKKTAPSSALALSKIKQVVGDRPKLLGAVLNMLIAEHGYLANTADNSFENPPTILQGKSALPCTLVSDILLTYGQLPRVYEHVGILARIMDTCVKNGIVGDDSIAQIQGCLRVIFQPAQGESGAMAAAEKDAAAKGSGSGDATSTSGAGEVKKKKLGIVGISLSSKTTATAAAKAKKQPRDDKEFQYKVIKKAIGESLSAMKQADPQNLFLNPVTDAIAPGYSSVIDKPMCMRTIEEKMMKSEYKTLTEYERDVTLMFQNCIKYNIGKEGQWFRDEARRQQKVWREHILGKAKAYFKGELVKRKKALDRAEAQAIKEEKKKKKEEEEKSKNEKATSAASTADAANDKKRKFSSMKDTNDYDDSDAINRLTASDISPLPPSKNKKRKKDNEYPSMPCLASMILSDPFVVRLLLDRLLRSIKIDVLRGKSIPVGHTVIPSLLQILNLCQGSAKLCLKRGKKFSVPDAGLEKATGQKAEDGAATAAGDNVSDAPFASLRKYIPMVTRLLLEVELDKRTAANGDLHDVAVQVLPPRPPPNPKEWDLAADTSVSPSSSFCVLRALVEGAFVQLIHFLQPTYEVALTAQIPRFEVALDKLSELIMSNGGNMLRERSFYMSLIHALLKHKSKLQHNTRDMIVSCWLKWFRVGVVEEGGGEGKKGVSGRESSMAAPVHECFILLLNEWASLGNIILPRDKLLSLSEDAAKAAEESENNRSGTKQSFARAWAKDDDTFKLIKAQYERMLKGLPDTHSEDWKKAMGVDDDSLHTLIEQMAAEKEEERKKKRDREKEKGKDKSSSKKKRKIKVQRTEVDL